MRAYHTAVIAHDRAYDQNGMMLDDHAQALEKAWADRDREVARHKLWFDRRPAAAGAER